MTEQDYDEAMYKQHKAWEDEQEHYASESAAVEVEIKAQEENDMTAQLTMPERGLKEKIAEIFRQAFWFAKEHPKGSEALDISSLTLMQADKILALIREAGWIDPSQVIMLGEFGTPKSEEILAQWAKDNGYVKPPESMELTELAELLVNLKPDIKTAKANIQSFLLANHYMELAEDQSLPRNPELGIPVLFAEYKEAQQEMLKQGWVKRKL